MNIYKVLETKKLNQYTLAKKSGLPLSTVKKIITGKNKIENCSGRTLRALANALDCTIEELLNMSFDTNTPNVQDFPNKKDYYKKVIGDRKNVVIAKESAANYLHLSNQDLDRNVYVYSSNYLPEPFIVTKVDNFNNLDYSKVNGLLVTSVDQTINDLLTDKESDEQVIRESLATYYFDNDESFDNLKINSVNEEVFKYYADQAIHYYDESEDE